MILEEIVDHKQQEIAERETHVSMSEVQRLAATASPPRTLTLDGAMSLIAEVKRRSPSRGEITAALDPAQQALAYECGGASAISVLTDLKFFGGSCDDLRSIRSRVEIPVLCKDFILTQYQVYEARSWGADLALLIVRVIDDRTLHALHALIHELGMMALVEVHDQHDLARAIAADATLIGINNRDLRDFSVDLVVTEYLAPLVPDGIPIVSESGIRSRDDVQRVAQAGATCVLVGEALMLAKKPEMLIKEMLG